MFKFLIKPNLNFGIFFQMYILDIKIKLLQDGDTLFEDLPNLLYSKYSDDYITFKKTKDAWNSNVLNRKNRLLLTKS